MKIVMPFYLLTGELTQGELYSAIKKEKEQTEAGEASTTHFSGEMHFYELVEDTKDGIWLIQVRALYYGISKVMYQEKLTFKAPVNTISVFGIPTIPHTVTSETKYPVMT